MGFAQMRNLALVKARKKAYLGDAGLLGS